MYEVLVIFYSLKYLYNKKNWETHWGDQQNITETIKICTIVLEEFILPAVPIVEAGLALETR